MSEASERERSTQAEASSASELGILSEAARAADVLLPRKGERRFWRRLGYPRAPQRAFLELFPPTALEARIEEPIPVLPATEGSGRAEDEHDVRNENAVEAGVESAIEAGPLGAVESEPEGAIEVKPEAVGDGLQAFEAESEGPVEVGSEMTVEPESAGAVPAGLESGIEAMPESVVEARPGGAIEAGTASAIEVEAETTVEDTAIETAPDSAAEAAPMAVYHSSAYDSAARALSEAIGRHERVMLLTGEPGSGKTTLCRALMERMDSRTFAALISGPFRDIEELLRFVLAAFGLISDVNVSGPHSTRHELRITLRDFLRSLEPLHARAILFVDDAHTLSADLLRRVSSFANIDGEKRLLQVVLVGGPQLRSALATPDLRTVDEQLTTRVELRPLTRVEFAEYLAFHAAQTGQAEPLILDVPSLTTQYEAANGLPGLVDADAKQPDSEVIPVPAAAVPVAESIVREPDPVALVPEPVALVPEPEPPERRTSPLTVALFGLVVVLGGLAAWVYGTRAIDLLKVWLGSPTAP